MRVGKADVSFLPYREDFRAIGLHYAPGFGYWSIGFWSRCISVRRRFYK